jgi:hypothetical protein
VSAQQLDLLADDVALDDALADRARRRIGCQTRDDVRAIRRQEVRRWLAAERLPASRPQSGDEYADVEDLCAGVAIPGVRGACLTCHHALVRHEVGARKHCEVCTCTGYARLRGVRPW